MTPGSWQLSGCTQAQHLSSSCGWQPLPDTATSSSGTPLHRLWPPRSYCESARKGTGQPFSGLGPGFVGSARSETLKPNVECWTWKSLSRARLFATPYIILHGILQARTLEWVAFPFSRGSSQLRNQTQVSLIAGGFFTSWATREALKGLLSLGQLLILAESLQRLDVHVGTSTAVAASQRCCPPGRTVTPGWEVDLSLTVPRKRLSFWGSQFQADLKLHRLQTLLAGSRAGLPAPPHRGCHGRLCCSWFLTLW